MVGRVKFQVWNEAKNYWADALCKTKTAEEHALRFVQFGFTVRVDGLVYQPAQALRAAA